ncbi:DNA-binding SARP family transcriptional activator [Nocardioides sp. BE266]|uniref:AfsR/SARP family transcriptional regulator n=1 Tax=Nocardioides sp. BE266 TaxID=2817725 RepID=UPI00285FBD30|nr:BTAD domain-containing putative transcriptional regulator [Nocardioides sp. BE266]MDR7253272.1 DNA-binding SARP family transcriptional activator [Nocardioides sp. BE266]
MPEHSAVAVASARLRLIGGWQLVVDGAEVALGHREQRLVALLGLAAPGTRSRVASILWPDSTDEHALGSLRRAVWQCQRRCPGVLSASRSTLALAPEISVDVDDLRRAAGLTELPMDDGARGLLDVLRGPELLPGWFDDWVVDERTRLDQVRVESLERISQDALDRGDFALAVESAAVASQIEPLRESARELSVRGHIGRGDVGSAHSELRRYRDMLEEELGVAPSDRIQALVETPVEPPAPAPAPVSRQRVAPPAAPAAPAVAPAAIRPPARPEPPPPPPVQDLAQFLGDDRRHAGVRRVATALVGAAGVALAVSLAVALTGPDRSPEATRDPGPSTVITSPSPSADTTYAPVRTVKVRPVRSAAGSAAFDVRATRLPAEVRLVVRGRAGLRVVRHVVVRAADGREVVVDGLDAGTYQWSATSESASGVRGEVSVTTPPPPPVTTTTAVVTAAQTPSQAATPTPTPTPVQTPTSHTPSPSPSPSSGPTGTPTDPGTVAPTPVG